MGATTAHSTRRLALIVLAVVAVIAAVAVAVPFLISTDAVRKRIADQITHWTGRTFTFSGDPRLRLFPYLTVRLQDARLANPDGMGAEPFIAADTMTGKLEILPLFLGRLEFAEFRLANPRINLTTDAEGRPNWILDQGVVGSQAQKGDSERPGEDAAPPSPLADISLGRFIIRDGTLTYSDVRNGTEEVLTELNVDFSWRRTAEAAGGSGTFVWRDEPVALHGAISAPLALLAGGQSAVRFAVDAAPASLAFEGTARQFDGMQVEGEAGLKTPSVARLVKWTGAPVGSDPVIGAAALTGKVGWAAATLNLSEASIDVDGNVAEGALTAALVDGRPSIQGTLAFEKFDLSPYLASLAGRLAADPTWKLDPAHLSVLDAGDIDLRLSASQAIARSAEFGPVAATVLVKGGALSVEVGEAHIGEGVVEASLDVSTNAGILSGKASFKLDNVPARPILGDLVGLTAIDGTGTATIDLSAAGARWGDIVTSLAGTARVSIVDGVVTGMDVSRLPLMLSDPAAAASSEASTSFATASSTLTIGGGTVTTDDFQAEGEGFALDLSGKAWLFEPGVEARGVVTIKSETPGEVPFIIGGTWREPSLEPDLGRPMPREPGDGLPLPPNG